MESELARVLDVMVARGEHALSPTLREAWDSGNLNVMSRKDPLRATDAHVSICGHITREELLQVLKATETANGFANRFLWVAVRRSKCLPGGRQRSRRWTSGRS